MNRNDIGQTYQMILSFVRDYIDLFFIVCRIHNVDILSDGGFFNVKLNLLRGGGDNCFYWLSFRIGRRF